MIDLATRRIAVLVPCFNEAATIVAIVRDFQACLPGATIYVFDNNSTDDTARIAGAAGATVRSVALQGKGNVIRRMFADVDAELYVMVDGDATYDATAAPHMVRKLLEEGLDMVVGKRCSDEQDAYRAGHRFGNRLLTSFVAALFGDRFSDMLSGYRVFSRRYVKSFAAHSSGFETETELTVHALQLRMPVGELPTVYKSRPEGSLSKLHTYRDGARILFMIVRLFKNERPLHFFGIGALATLLLALFLAEPLFMTWLETGMVHRLPTALLCTGLGLLSFVLLSSGLVLDTVTKGRIEQKRFAYLAVPPPAP